MGVRFTCYGCPPASVGVLTPTVGQFSTYAWHGPVVGPSSHGRPTVRPPFWPTLLFSLSHGSAMVFGPKRRVLTKAKQVKANESGNNRGTIDIFRSGALWVIQTWTQESSICLKVKIVFHAGYMCGLPNKFTVKWLKINWNIPTYAIVGVIG